MRVVEVFNSIDGEGKRAGELATFVRFAGCNLRCVYCDTSYALSCKQGKEISLEDLYTQLKNTSYHNITLTGGEPLLQKDILKLVILLCGDGYSVNIETNGSKDIEPFLLLKNCILTMDYKMPFSEQENKMLLENIEKLRSNDVLKFVCAESDLLRLKEILSKYKIKADIYLSPVFKKIEPKKLVEFLKENYQLIKHLKIKVQLQLHKFIWKPEEKGV